MLCLTSERRTKLHDWPAGVKLTLLAGLTLALLLWPWGAVLVLPLLLGLYAGLGLLGQGLRLLRSVAVFAALIWLGQGLYGRWELGALTAFRLLALVAAANLVTLTSQLSQMLVVFERLLFWLPEKVRVQISLALALAIRFVPVLGERLEALRLAWRARAVRAPSWRLVLPLLVSVLDDAERVGEALRARSGLE